LHCSFVYCFCYFFKQSAKIIISQYDALIFSPILDSVCYYFCMVIVNKPYSKEIKRFGIRNMNKKVAFFTLGCKLNFAETSSLAAQFENNGYLRTEQFEESDIVVINTCAVTSLAEKKGRNIISRAKRANPNAKIIAMGCYSQLRPEELDALNHVDLILGNEEKFKIFEYLEKEESGKIFTHPFKEITSFDSAWSSSDRTRTFLKVQDGCDYFCAYCTIPMARGLSRSPKIESVLSDIEKIIENGSQEIILTGVNVGDFGKQQNETFYQLLQSITQTKLNRLRLSSIEPNLITDEIIELVAQNKMIMPHFHIPLQCGTNKLLESMNRRYTTELYANKVALIKSAIPEACIAADVIVGVPGETEKDHQESINFLKSIDISYLHVFTYSERPGTKAAKMELQISKQIKNERSKALHELSNEFLLKFLEKNLNKTKEVLFEKEIKDGYIYGFTDNYVRTKVRYVKGLENSINQTLLVKIDENNDVLGQIKTQST
jgi:threonylcarbamoyladenosine tRNA methylthiotransferase MtaB